MDSDEDTLIERALIVGEEFCDFDPNETPTNGHEYLLCVRNEARNCPSVLSATVNRKKLKEQTYYVEENKKPGISNIFIPSEEWQCWQCEEFDRIRADISNKRDYLPFQMTNSLQVPDEYAEESAWFSYCFEEEELQEKVLLSQVLRLKQTSVNDLLGYFCNWLQDERISFTRNTCLWLYALLSCIEIPLIPDTFSNIRRIAQEAVKVRSRLEDANDQSLVRLNLIICIVGKYFKQIDLADV